MAISLEVIQWLQIDQYRNCQPLSHYYCINARCMAWIYFGPCPCMYVCVWWGLQILCVIAVDIASPQREWDAAIANRDRGKMIFIVNINLAIDQWYDGICLYLFWTIGSAHCASYFPAFFRLFRTECEVIKAFGQIKIHLDHSACFFLSSLLNATLNFC